MTLLKHLVVVLPGILGSVLRDERGRKVWGPGVWDIAGTAAFGPSALSVGENGRLDPVSLIDTVSLVGRVVAPGYDVLVRNVLQTFPGTRVDTARSRNWSPKPDTDMLLVPYDFRVGVEAAAKYVRDRVAHQHRLQPRRRMLVLAHSMGGLIARYWLGCLEIEGETDASITDAVITMGTPHGGAPKALDVLANGLRLGAMKYHALTKIAREWQAVYDLLPRYPAVAFAGADPQYPRDLDVLAQLRLSQQVHAAHQLHCDIDSAWASMHSTPRQTAVFACGHKTLTRAGVESSGLVVTKEPAEWMPNPGWDGDGTVPAFCAIPNDLEDRNAWRPVPERHLPMLGAGEIMTILRAEAGDSVSSVRGEQPKAPWLGLDLEETYPPGPVTVTADLHGAIPDDKTGVWVTALRGDDHVARERAVRVGEAWVAMLVGLPKGEFTIRVEATNVPGHDNIRCEDTIGVVGI